MELLYNYLFLKMSSSIFVVSTSKIFTKNAETKINKEQPKQYSRVPNCQEWEMGGVIAGLNP